MSIDDAFNKFTRYKKTKFGHEVSCIKGLLCICAPDKVQAITEAKHYFAQYFSDGEYV
jgi:hypothetical protein